MIMVLVKVSNKYHDDTIFVCLFVSISSIPKWYTGYQSSGWMVDIYRGENFSLHISKRMKKMRKSIYLKIFSFISFSPFLTKWSTQSNTHDRERETETERQRERDRETEIQTSKSLVSFKIHDESQGEWIDAKSYIILPLVVHKICQHLMYL